MFVAVMQSLNVVPSSKEFHSFFVECVNPCTCDVEKVMEDIGTMHLSSFDYCRDGGAVKQELTEVFAGWCAKAEDEFCDGWYGSTIVSGEVHQFHSGGFKSLAV